MTRRRTLIGVGAAVCLTLGALCVAPHRPAVPASSDRIDDRAFWGMVTGFSEPEGYFRSDNLVSNETTFQAVIPELERRTAAGGVYLGVGPEQNFTYIVALRPRLAFIIDIRRQNLLLHLFYKALMELSTDRADFVGRLFSRPRPASLNAASTVKELFDAYDTVAPSRQLFLENLRLVRDRLVRVHGFGLSTDDLHVIEVVYEAFHAGGPDLTYAFPRLSRGYGGFRGYLGYGGRFPSYATLMTETDDQGRPQSYLASEARFQTLKALEEENRIVPVVGDFAGDKALRAVGDYLRRRGVTVTAFYTSNVEQYLFRGDDWRRFFGNVSTLPVDDASTFIRAYFNYRFRDRSMPPGPRSVTLLNPISRLLTAFHQGRIQGYDDVIALSIQTSIPADANR